MLSVLIVLNAGLMFITLLKNECIYTCASKNKMLGTAAVSFNKIICFEKPAACLE